MKARDYLIEEYTTTVCPHCFDERPIRSDEPGVFKDGMLVTHDGKVWMRRFCEVHGETESLYEEDAQIWRSRIGWSTPTSQIVADRSDNIGGFPHAYRNGLPASHGQHTCILLLNVIETCNLECPACYASAKPGVDHKLPSIGSILNTVKQVIEREGGHLGVLMISGGEPTIRKDLCGLLEALFPLNITRILINTNGRRIARDAAFVEFLSRHKQRVEIYLQFDGFRDETYIRLRGEALASEKLAAVKHLTEAGVYFTLVATVQKGTNDDEIGKIAMFGLETPKCAGLAIQPMFGSGRVPKFDPMDRCTPTGVLRRLESQTNGVISSSDFIPLPCSHRDCCDITYFIKSADGSWKSLPALIGRDELKNWIHLVANTISFELASSSVRELLKEGVIQRVLSEQQKTSSAQLGLDLIRMCGCIP